VADSHLNRSMLQRLSFMWPRKVSQEGLVVSSNSCFLNLKSMYKPGSTIKFREALE
jgi:hypothetical protein